MNEKTCNNCKWFDRRNAERFGDCRKGETFATVVLPDEDFCCNQWEKKEEE